jgi:hypothetical protein
MDKLPHLICEPVDDCEELLRMTKMVPIYLMFADDLLLLGRLI